MKNTNISALRAEVLLNHLYPEQSDSWVVTNKGTFYRNYSEDVLQLDANLSQVSLSRDGLLRLLPQGLVNTKDELKTAEELFVPFDSWRFRDSLRAEEDFAYLRFQASQFFGFREMCGNHRRSLQMVHET